MRKLTDYATVVMTSVARAPDRTHSAANLALQTGLTLPSVARILKSLAPERLLISVRGAKGGDLLARAPGEISIAQVIDAMEGPVGITEARS